MPTDHETTSSCVATKLSCLVVPGTFGFMSRVRFPGHLSVTVLLRRRRRRKAVSRFCRQTSATLEVVVENDFVVVGIRLAL